MPIHEVTHPGGAPRRDRLPVAYRDDVRLELGQAAERLAVLLLVQVERGPAGAPARPGGDGVSGDQEVRLRPVERQVARRVTGREHDLQRADAVALVDEVVDRAGRVLAEPEREADLEGEVRAERPPRHEAHGLRLPLAADDVRLPLVRVDPGSAPLAQQPRPTEVRPVPVRQDDVPQLLGATARPGDRVQHPLTVRVVERVDQRQALPVVEEERVHTAALPLAEAEHARRELRRYPPTRFHGWNAFSTPRSAGASSGKWRSRTGTIELSLIQSRPW